MRGKLLGMVQFTHICLPFHLIGNTGAAEECGRTVYIEAAFGIKSVVGCNKLKI